MKRPKEPCAHCGTLVTPRGPEPAVGGRYCGGIECQRARYRAQNALRGQSKPAKACVHCGENIPTERGRRGTCSDECATERRREIQREFARQRALDIPGYNQRRAERSRERAAADPAYAARLREYAVTTRRRHQERYYSDPAYREETLAYHRDRYQRNREQVRARRRELFAAMTPEERAAWRDSMRAAWRKYQRLWRSERMRDPARQAEYLQAQAEYRRLRALEEMGAEAGDLVRRLEQ